MRGIRIGVALLAVAGLVWGFPGAASAQLPSLNNLGYDVSYPQCGTTLPDDASFAVVGVNGGRTDRPNPCLHEQMRWALSLPGYAAQPRLSVYINTANPGPQSAVWSSDALSPYGMCDGSWSTACSWEYGRYRAAETFESASGVADELGVELRVVPWWLDIETANTWAKPSDTEDWAAVNIATIEGYIAGLVLQGIAPPLIGIYAARAHWSEITGLTYGEVTRHFPPFHPNWVPGAESLEGARERCHPDHSITGGPVTLVQYVPPSLDKDYACP